MMDDPDGACGFYKGDYATARKSADYLHNLTTILMDSGSLARPGQLNYSIRSQPATVHDMLLQKSNGTFELAVWSELGPGREPCHRESERPSRIGENLRPDDGRVPNPDPEQ